jgi:phosphoribosylformimino-5-aminoimidazole carboxamide ribotide isomerase
VILFPAVDIQGGRAVRLRLGHFDEETVYADSPLEAARAWTEGGARYLHVVDLDGARTGFPQHLEDLRRMTEELEPPVQYGGGLRTLDAVRAALEAGAQRVVLGTAALRDERLLDAALELAGPDRVVVAVDVRGGLVSVAGWTEGSELTAEALVERLEGRGARIFAYTSVDRDGTLAGPDLEGLRRVAATTDGRVIASGGVSSLDDLVALRDLELDNLEGVIAGKALYERRFSVAEGNTALAAGSATPAATPGARAASTEPE